MPTPSINEVMEAYAADAEADARRRGLTLDYSEPSLEHVDRILETISPDGALNPRSDAEKDELWTLSKMYGGYVGQVVIKQMGGQWELQDLHNGGARVVLNSGGLRAFPTEKVYRRLTEDPLSGVSGYLRAMRAIIESRKRGQ
jgi:hypothetical protein